MDFNERAIPGITSNMLMKEAISRYHFALKKIKTEGTLVDMACGTGYGTSILSNKAKIAYGIDIEPEAIQFAQKKYSNLRCVFFVSEVEKTIFKNGAVDTVIGFEMIEHLYQPRRFLSEVSRILDKTGVFILSTPNREVVSEKGTVMSPYHTKEYNYTELRNLLKKYFKTVEFYGQSKSQTAMRAQSKFLKSQKARQWFVDLDYLNLRKLVPRNLKENLWKFLGSFFGRASQSSINESEFLINKKDVEHSEYFIVICRK